jgi:hypothetical protein
MLDILDIDLKRQFFGNPCNFQPTPEINFLEILKILPRKVKLIPDIIEPRLLPASRANMNMNLIKDHPIFICLPDQLAKLRIVHPEARILASSVTSDGLATSRFWVNSHGKFELVDFGDLSDEFVLPSGTDVEFHARHEHLEQVLVVGA